MTVPPMMEPSTGLMETRSWMDTRQFEYLPRESPVSGGAIATNRWHEYNGFRNALFQCGANGSRDYSVLIKLSVQAQPRPQAQGPDLTTCTVPQGQGGGSADKAPRIQPATHEMATNVKMWWRQL
eukprot:1495756-Rhodomonas_salina.1